MNYKTLSVICFIFFGILLTYSEACSCMPSHPQSNFCSSDFVILARIRKEVKSNFYKIYKAKIRKEFKMSEKARVALKSGRIQTPIEGSMCGVDLELGQLYLISGRVSELQAHVSLCGFHRLWKDITPRQRKGFKLLYGKGCSCKISFFHRLSATRDHCLWNKMDCQSKFGICLRSPSGQCNWAKSLDLKKCIKGDFDSITTTLETNIDNKQPISHPEPYRTQYYNSANLGNKFIPTIDKRNKNNIWYKPS